MGWLGGKFVESEQEETVGEDAVADSLPKWAGLCSDALMKNTDGPHDMQSIRASVTAAERLGTV